MNPQLQTSGNAALAVPPRRPGRTRLGVMGGTFDPIHHGHLVAASEVAAVFDLDEVVFVPTGTPWQKADQRVTEAEHRYLMTVIATASNPRFTVSRVDIDRPGPTYTVDTLRDLHQLRPNADLFFITGADAMAQILSWKDAAQMWDLAYFVGVTRPGHELAAPERAAGVGLLEVPAMAISSTDVRRRSADGKPVWYLVPDGVVQYINKYELYHREDVTASERTGQGPDELPGGRTDPAARPVESQGNDAVPASAGRTGAPGASEGSISSRSQH
ncbi:nicotinate-nucleotide adenylyltransferase [Rothia kristinae]|uniref:Probable nicotinate-nucleotide adenylyltransferase n=2 Tax=Rothia kristinae TaxID=37923 RepID=A0A7T4MTU5_9MICC|nr:nicotinate-nucleotide adenylyltransferase [Actinomycetes bacterium]QQC59500.1 nicotinate-nucleotide adenylyltransferase [Rothia kristinae]